MSDQASITLKDVARRAGVSIATVSRVLNHTGYVSPEVETRVREAVDALGYYQNYIARSLKTNSTMTIGLITADISNPYIITVAKAVEDVIHAQNYNLLMCSTNGDPEQELECMKLLMGRNIDGLLLNGTGYNEAFVSGISVRIPLVLIHRRYLLPSNNYDLVDSDNEAGVYNLTRHLISFGHRRIFVIKGSGNTSSHMERFQGFCRAMAEIGVAVDKAYPYQYDGNFTRQSGFLAIEKLCSLPAPPTAIIALNNTMAVGALEGLKANHLNVPEDISIASYNNVEYRDLMAVRPTVHDVDPREIGLLAGHALLERLASPKLPVREFIVEGRVIPGNAVSIPTATV